MNEGKRLFIGVFVCFIVLLIITVLAIMKPWQQTLEDRAMAMFGEEVDFSSIDEDLLERYIEFLNAMHETSLTEYPGSRMIRLTWIAGYGRGTMGTVRLDLSHPDRSSLVYKGRPWGIVDAEKVRFAGTATIPPHSVQELEMLLDMAGFWEGRIDLTAHGGWNHSYVGLVEVKDGERRYLIEWGLAAGERFGEVFNLIREWRSRERRSDEWLQWFDERRSRD